MRIVVLGAGVVGVTAAWYLATDGHDVTVIDRQGGPALETSFANGGQISAAHAEPWANPGTPRKIGGLEGLIPRSASYRFEVRLAPDGGRWKVYKASWTAVR